MQLSRAKWWHKRAVALGLLCQEQSRIVVEARAGTVLDAATTVLHHDLLIAHASVLAIVEGGWSSSAAAVVRSMLDMYISQLAMYRSVDSQFAAFKYLYASFRTLERDAAASASERCESREVLRTRIASLPERDRPAALEYLRDRERGYWFSPEWRSPADVLERLGIPLGFVYKQFSAAAHGGFLGLRTFRDDPDRLDIGPRVPPGYRSVGVINIATRIVLEMCATRSLYESLACASTCAGRIGAFNVEVMTASRAAAREQPE